jgi:hypothetical protein
MLNDDFTNNFWHKSTLVVPEHFTPNFGNFQNKKSGNMYLYLRTRVGKPTAGLRKGMLDLSGKVRLGKVY